MNPGQKLLEVLRDLALTTDEIRAAYDDLGPDVDSISPEVIAKIDKILERRANLILLQEKYTKGYLSLFKK